MEPALDALLGASGLAVIAQVDGGTLWGPGPGPSPATAAPPEIDGPSPRLLTVAEAARALPIGRSSLYELIGRGELRVVHIGRSARIAAGEVERLVAELQDAAGPEGGRRT